MPLAQLALIVAALFAGAAIQVAAAEHPARMVLDDEAALAHWKQAYRRGRIILAILALAAGLLAFWVWWHSLNQLWLIGALLMLANLPFTLLVILPVNRALEAIPVGGGGPASRELLVRWGRLHVIRADLGGTAALVMLIAFYWRV